MKRYIFLIAAISLSIFTVLIVVSSILSGTMLGAFNITNFRYSPRFLYSIISFLKMNFSLVLIPFVIIMLRDYLNDLYRNRTINMLMIVVLCFTMFPFVLSSFLSSFGTINQNAYVEFAKNNGNLINVLLSISGILSSAAYLVIGIILLRKVRIISTIMKAFAWILIVINALGVIRYFNYMIGNSLSSGSDILIGMKFFKIPVLVGMFLGMWSINLTAFLYISFIVIFFIAANKLKTQPIEPMQVEMTPIDESDISL